MKIEPVTVWKRITRDLGRGGVAIISIPISLPRVRFLEIDDGEGGGFTLPSDQPGTGGTHSRTVTYGETTS